MRYCTRSRTGSLFASPLLQAIAGAVSLIRVVCLVPSMSSNHHCLTQQWLCDARVASCKKNITLITSTCPFLHPLTMLRPSRPSRNLRTSHVMPLHNRLATPWWSCLQNLHNAWALLPSDTYVAVACMSWSLGSSPSCSTWADLVISYVFKTSPLCTISTIKNQHRYGNYFSSLLEPSTLHSTLLQQSKVYEVLTLIRMMHSQTCQVGRQITQQTDCRVGCAS